VNARLAALALLLAGYAGAIRADPPDRLGDLRLVHALQGADALREINRLHGKELAARSGYVAHYEKRGAVAMLYLAQAASADEAERQLKRMGERIRRGGSPFYHLKTSKQGAITLYSVLGQGQIHYFYRRDSGVVWLAADATVAETALAALVEQPQPNR